jgi:hypothetical protein
MAQAYVTGQWATLPQLMPINPIHAALLPSGQIFITTGSGNCPPSQKGCPAGPPYGPSNGSGALLYDPNASGNKFTQFSVSWDMFCNNMSVLPDGRVLIAGGTALYDPFYGASNASIFQPWTNSFINLPPMAQGRWYPTTTILGDGRVMVFSGLSGPDGTGNGGYTTNLVEIFDPDALTWTTVNCDPSSNCFLAAAAGSTAAVPLYPRQHLLPDGTVLYSGPNQATLNFNPTNGAWSLLGFANYGWRGYGTSVLLPLTPVNNYVPKVIIMGGDNPGTATTEIGGFGPAYNPNQTWSWGPNMSEPRVEMNAVILPTGKVLALGGSTYDEDATSASLNADLYDPATNTFSSAGANVYPRLYHSVALLLPDATVWLAGGNPSRGTYEQHMEIYKPAYLFNQNGSLATRPSISNGLNPVTWGQKFTVNTTSAASITSVVLMRNGAVTHGFNTDQRLVGMSFTKGSGQLTVTAPPNGNIVPKGYYMLFIVNSSGVPSVSRSIKLQP